MFWSPSSNSHRKPWVIAETSLVRIFRCGECGDTHIEVGTVSLRLGDHDLERFHSCLKWLADAKPLSVNAHVRQRHHAFTFKGWPCQILLSNTELRQLINSVEHAIAVLAVLREPCPCYRNN